MSGFERMNTEEREPFDAYVLRQQNRALRAAMTQKRRRVHELSRALAEQRQAQQASAAMVACADRHWRQLEADARLLLSGGGNGGAVDEGGGGREGVVGRVLLPKALDRLLLADVTKLAEAVAAGADPGGLDEVVKYEDEEEEGWLAGFALGQQEGEEGGDGEKRGGVKKEEGGGNGVFASEELPAVERAVQERCAAVRSLIEQVGRRLSSVNAGAAEGPSPPASVEGQRRLQAECALLRDRLLQARRTQAELYRGLIRALKDRHRLLRPYDWGLAHAPSSPDASSPPAGENGEMNGGVEGEAAACHGEQKSAGHKRRRSDMAGPSAEGEQAASEVAAELAAVTERAAEQEALAGARLEEVERLRGEKAALERRVTALVAAAGEAEARSSGSRLPPVSDEQVLASPLYAQAVAEREAVSRRVEGLAQGVAQWREKCRLLEAEARRAVEEERAAWVARVGELEAQGQALQRAADEAAAEAEAGRLMRRQLDEGKVLLDLERAEVERARGARRQQAEEMEGLRAECASLRQRLAAVSASGDGSAEVAALRAENEQLSAFKETLLEGTESLTQSYNELKAAHDRLKAQAEERERRWLREKNDELRAKVGDQVQVARVAQLEKRVLAAEALKRQHEEAVRGLSEQLQRAGERWQAAVAERTAAEERVEGQLRAAHGAERARAAAEEARGKAEGRAGAMARRAEELAGQLEAVEGERRRLKEEVGGLERRVSALQGQVESQRQQGAGAGMAGAAGGMSDTVVEGMRKMLNCSVCNVRFKDTIITKCSHLFCRGCVDENLKVRSRKCPACGKGYSQADVKAFYFT